MPRTDPTVQEVMAYIIQVARQMGVDPNLALAIAGRESGYSTTAYSSSGAIGVMQLMPGTARGLGVDPYDWKQNVQGGVKYLRQGMQMFPGNVAYVIGGYNAGYGNPTGYQDDYLGLVSSYMNMYAKYGASYETYAKYSGAASSSSSSPFGAPPPTQQGGGGRDPIIGEYNGFPIYQSQFRALMMHYNSVGAEWGITLDAPQVWDLIHKNVTPELWGTRAKALQWVNNNRYYLDAFQKVVGKKLTQQDRLNIALGQAGDWNTIWNQAALGGAAETQGFKFLPKATKFQQRAGAGDLVLTSADIKSFIAKVGASPDPNTLDYQKWLSQGALAIHRFMGQSRYQGLGLKPQDLLDIAAGQGTPKAQETVDRLIKEEDLFRKGQGFGAVTGMTKGQPAVETLAGLAGNRFQQSA